jgi:ribose/xylose/arabinose/galactoside ABC-type transport system permease subunit
MGLLQRRTRFGQVIKDVGDGQLPDAVKSALTGVPVPPPKAITSGVTAVVAVTAGSAAVSALRRRGQTPGNDQ